MSVRETGRQPTDRTVNDARVIVSRQAGCTPERALILMLDTATATDETLQDIARAVLDHRVSFGSPP